MPLNLKTIRKWVDQCDSTADAARRLEIKRESLARILSGDHTNLTLSTLEHFADVMGVEPAELIKRAVIV